MCADHKRAEHYFLSEDSVQLKSYKAPRNFSISRSPLFHFFALPLSALSCVCSFMFPGLWMEETLRSLISAGSCSLLVCCNTSHVAFWCESFPPCARVRASTSVGKQVAWGETFSESFSTYTQPWKKTSFHFNVFLSSRIARFWQASLTFFCLRGTRKSMFGFLLFGAHNWVLEKKFKSFLLFLGLSLLLWEIECEVGCENAFHHWAQLSRVGLHASITLSL